MTAQTTDHLATAAARGFGWAGLARFAAKLSWLIALAVLARLLPPEAFGLFTFGLVVLLYVETIGDLGAGAALVYAPERQDDTAQVVFWINTALGLAWCGTAQLLAPWVASFFGRPEAEPVLRLLALSFVLKGLGNTHDALCRKELRFRSRLVPELALSLGKAILAIGLASAGYGVWSLVWGQLGGLVLWLLALWLVVPWRPRWRWPRGIAGGVLRFGRGMVAVNLLAAVVHHADLVVVGRMLGATALGLYQLAARVPEMAITTVVRLSGQVLFPTFSRLHAAGERLSGAYLAALRWVAAVTLPAAAGLAVLAQPVIVSLFGPRWQPAAPVLQALAVYAGLRALGSQAGDILKATGRTQLLAGLGLVKTVLLVPMLIVAGRSGITVLAWTLAAVTAVTMLLNLVVAARILALTPRQLVSQLAAPAAAAGTMLVVLLVMRNVLPSWTSIWTAALLVPVGVLVYAVMLHRLTPGLLAEGWRRLRGESAGAGLPAEVR